MQDRPEGAASPSAAIAHAKNVIRKQLEDTVNGTSSEDETTSEKKNEKDSSTTFTLNNVK